MDRDLTRKHTQVYGYTRYCHHQSNRCYLQLSSRVLDKCSIAVNLQNGGVIWFFSLLNKQLGLQEAAAKKIIAVTEPYFNNLILLRLDVHHRRFLWRVKKALPTNLYRTRFACSNMFLIFIIDKAERTSWDLKINRVASLKVFGSL